MRKIPPALYSSIEELDAQAADLLAKADLLPCDQRQPLFARAKQLQNYADMKRWLTSPSLPAKVE